MLNLWRKTLELFRKYPILWAPYIAAMVIGLLLSWLWRFEAKHIVVWLATRQTESKSVLGGNFSRSTFDFSIQTAMRVRAALQWGTDYLEICINSAALVFTAMMVGAVLRNERSVVPAVIAKFRHFPRRILFYSLKAWVLVVFLYVVFDWPFYLPLPSMPLGHVAFSLLSQGLFLLNSLCFAWVMAPIAITLLRPVGSNAVSRADQKLGRYSFMLTVALTHLLRYCLEPLAQRLYVTSSSLQTLARDFASLVGEFPYVLLYIALALIADAELRECAVEGDPGFRERLRKLMPLHFLPDQQP